MNTLITSGSSRIPLADEAFLLKGFLLGEDRAILAELSDLALEAPFRHMVTPGGYSMSVSMTNCGPRGWVTDRQGYRYDTCDPLSGRPWPAMPPRFLRLAEAAAGAAGFAGFRPDACLINRYVPGARLSLHQDKDELDFSQPIVSFSLGLPATFEFGGLTRKAPVTPWLLEHGDVVVWGGSSRLRYHGVRPLRKGTHPLLGDYRINMTFRCAG
ncbi:alpha-ketoglutarate-dependent dioxygenase (plasmid) [Raoultella ornithinolytica]|uniref:DNA oxidative demethylase AlkB n=1 Tax=Raoultella ornithinolytica TaxID=54291 RepID=UPI00084A1DB2|nr:DNA oxidative demethylase AlkB [Raoultella ornithinolytica]AOO59972.1 alpha-ketoglutarate-dependent dioxygenase [Raoultella ornithinolytica]